MAVIAGGIGVAIPTADQFGYIGHTVAIKHLGWDSGISWFWPWAASMVVAALAQWSSSGRDLRRWENYALDHAGSLGGYLEQINQAFRRQHDPDRDALSEDRITGAILQGAVNSVRSFLGLPADVTLSAAMLVPHRRQPRGGPKQSGLRVCNRNALHSSRPFTIIPFKDEGPAATCLREGRVVVAENTREPPYDTIFQDRPYESVIAFPVPLIGGEGSHLAVVTLDSDRPYTFTEGMLAEGFEQIVAPYLQLIALARFADPKEEIHGTTGNRDSPPQVGKGKGNAYSFPEE